MSLENQDMQPLDHQEASPELQQMQEASSEQQQMHDGMFEEYEHKDDQEMKHSISAEQQESYRSPSAAQPASIEGESVGRATGHQAGAKAEEKVLRKGLGKQHE